MLVDSRDVQYDAFLMADFRPPCYVQLPLCGYLYDYKLYTDRKPRCGSPYILDEPI